MLLVITIFIAVAGFLMIDHCQTALLETAGMLLAAAGAVMSAILIIGSAVIQIDAEGTKQRLIADREILVYQLDNKLYEDDILGKKELYNQIQDWNSKVIYNKTMQDNLFIDFMIPDIYTDIEPIDYK